MAKVDSMPILIKEREILRYFNMGHNNNYLIFVNHSNLYSFN